MRLLLTVIALCLAGCNTAPDGYISVPVIPAWIQPENARTYTAAEVIVKCAELAPGASVQLSDSVFTPLSHEWAQKIPRWSWEFGMATDLGEWKEESLDCDKIALGVAFAANVAASRAGVKAQPLAARIHAWNNVSFGGIPAGGAHALNAFLTDRPPYYWVYEPQTRVWSPLDEYPNRKGIFLIRIGG